MAVLIDPPMWPAHGRLWSHLVSDVSLAELHAFAAGAGIPARGFEGDHYDVPQERYEQTLRAGAQPVSGRELLARLQASGLRLAKRRGQKVLAAHLDATGLRTDAVAGVLAPLGPVTGVRALAPAPDGTLPVLSVGAGYELPALPGVPGTARQVGYVRVVEPPAREVSAVLVVHVPPASLQPGGLHRLDAVAAAGLLGPPWAALLRHLMSDGGRRPWP